MAKATRSGAVSRMLSFSDSARPYAELVRMLTMRCLAVPLGCRASLEHEAAWPLPLPPNEVQSGLVLHAETMSRVAKCPVPSPYTVVASIPVTSRVVQTPGSR